MSIEHKWARPDSRYAMVADVKESLDRLSSILSQAHYAYKFNPDASERAALAGIMRDHINSRKGLDGLLKQGHTILPVPLRYPMHYAYREDDSVPMLSEWRIHFRKTMADLELFFCGRGAQAYLVNFPLFNAPPTWTAWQCIDMLDAHVKLLSVLSKSDPLSPDSAMPSPGPTTEQSTPIQSIRPSLIQRITRWFA